MRYLIGAFVLQIIALLLCLVALGLASYVFHYDGKWYKIVQLEGHIYFESFITKILQNMYKSTKEEFSHGGFSKHHRLRHNPPDDYTGNFLRFTKSPEIIFMTLLVLANLMQLVALIITCVRKIRFLPQPCRENGCWYLIIGLICLTAGIIELISRLEINTFYATFHSLTKSSQPDEKMGALMMSSCGGDNYKYYEKQLIKLSKLKERDSLHVCQRFIFFIVVVVLVFLCAILCFIVALLLCCFWRKKRHVEEADAESLENLNKSQNSTNPDAPPTGDNGQGTSKGRRMDVNENPSGGLSSNLEPNSTSKEEQEIGQLFQNDENDETLKSKSKGSHESAKGSHESAKGSHESAKGSHESAKGAHESPKTKKSKDSKEEPEPELKEEPEKLPKLKNEIKTDKKPKEETEIKKPPKLKEQTKPKKKKKRLGKGSKTKSKSPKKK